MKRYETAIVEPAIFEPVGHLSEMTLLEPSPRLSRVPLRNWSAYESQMPTA